MTQRLHCYNYNVQRRAEGVSDISGSRHTRMLLLKQQPVGVLLSSVQSEASVSTQQQVSLHGQYRGWKMFEKILEVQILRFY